MGEQLHLVPVRTEIRALGERFIRKIFIFIFGLTVASNNIPEARGSVAAPKLLFNCPDYFV
jgi:hypothetical protein